MKIILTIILSLFSISILSAQTITGRVLDKEENPLIYATIQITNDFGVLSNEEGRFLIETENFKITDSVTISYLGYKKLRFELKDLESKNYYLEENINELDEVIVSNKNLSIKEILEKIRVNASKNYSTANTKQRIFHRATTTNNYKNFDFNFEKSNLIRKDELKRLNRSMDSLVKKNINSSSTNYEAVLSELYSQSENSKIKVIKATKLINKNKDNSEDRMQEVFLTTVAKYLEKGETYKVKSGIIKVEDSLNVETDFKDDNEYGTKGLRKNYSEIISNYKINSDSKLDFIFKNNKYNYILDGISYLEDELVYTISFTPKSSAAKYEGTIYINSDDFAVIKAKFHFAKGKIGRKLNLKMLMGMKFFENKWSSEILYQKNEVGKYQLRFVKQEIGMSMYIKRPLKFTKNRKSRSEEKKTLKINFLMEFLLTEKDELFFINTEDITTSQFTNFKEKEEYNIELIPKYTPEIWKGYNVLSPVEAIKNYDTGEH